VDGVAKRRGAIGAIGEPRPLDGSRDETLRSFTVRERCT
jgi:hypothetical protein